MVLSRAALRVKPPQLKWLTRPAWLASSRACAAFYFVFKEVMDAAEFALELSDLVTTTAWELRGLPSNLNIRISLHAAPVFKVVDPGT